MNRLEEPTPFHRDQTQYGHFDRTKTLTDVLRMRGIGDAWLVIEHAIKMKWVTRPTTREISREMAKRFLDMGS